MIDNEDLDVRTITMGISLLDCIDPDVHKASQKVYDKICRYAQHLVKTGEDRKPARTSPGSTTSPLSTSASPSPPSP